MMKWFLALICALVAGFIYLSMLVATLLTLENDIEKECDKTTMIYSTSTWPYSISTVANHPDCKEGK